MQNNLGLSRAKIYHYQTCVNFPKIFKLERYYYMCPYASHDMNSQQSYVLVCGQERITNVLTLKSSSQLAFDLVLEIHVYWWQLLVITY